ncbi:S8 family peptidase [Janthinobacterium agaricidamnosum]|uniref:Subtilisin domain protein n=1 Tax=Janthinobacterium agaricidamnosum NBRC 102515 = DSM 9628 TaxID=1349767 RepID=W0V5I8_9BURK|nr:S8 family serine peptidase [Janthinobacterium agaricidamnosum]CDG82870.1 subtilisin domain protein [Janthinobacterium agaricidamnosum NBRC 102515 = DSM 9628]
MKASLLSLLLTALLASASLRANGAEPLQAVPSQPGAAAPGAYRDASERQVLVMLHMPAPHFRPDSGYSGAYTDNSGHSARRRIAAELAQRHGLTLLSDWPMPMLGIDCYVMEAPPGVQRQDAVKELAADPRVEWAQPIASFSALNHGDSARDPKLRDPLYATQPGAKFWHIAELHTRAYGRNVKVAVIDSGVEDNHPDLAGQVAVKENFVDGSAYASEKHGTAVAGIIAAKAGNGIGIEGVAPGARLMALRGCWEEADHSTRCNSFTLAKALNFAVVNKAQVINMSLGGPPDILLRRLIDAALQRGVTVVAAVDPNLPGGGFPAAYPGVIAAAAERSQAPGLDPVLAPGQDIPSTVPGGGWGLVSGTSFSAAHVAGMAALLEGLHPKQSLRRNSFLGSGIGSAGGFDACATVSRATGDCVCACAPVPLLKANK